MKSRLKNELKSEFWMFGILLSIAFASLNVFAEVKVNAPAPAFAEKDATGKTQSLADLTKEKKWVVLEWSNKDCPYVKKHYGSQNMQKLQQDYTAKGVVWLTVISSGKGKQGFLSPADAVKVASTQGSKATAILIDEDGSMGKAYDAKTTPHMFVINPEGKVAYAGAIDNNDSADPKVISGSQNFVKAALDSGMAGKPIAVTSHVPYGCSVKYN